MWLGEKINENGIGNGISIILFVNIISRLPSTALSLWRYHATLYKKRDDRWTIMLARHIVAIIASRCIVMVVFIVFSDQLLNARLPDPVREAVSRQKDVRRSELATCPLKLNMAGVMPIIFANSIHRAFRRPSRCSSRRRRKAPSGIGFPRLFSDTDSAVYAVLMFVVLIVLFSYFYIAISFNPIEVANNLKKNGGFDPRHLPASRLPITSRTVLNKVTLMGAFFLGVIAVLPLAADIVSGNR